MNSRLIVGLDEVGRGPWAGPLVAAAVMLPTSLSLDGVDDSKRLTPKTRESLTQLVKSAGISIGIGWVSPAEIDARGLTQATQEAMHTAYRQLPPIASEVVVDGSINYLDTVENSYALVRADSLVPAVSAASLIAKIHRDAYMQQLATSYPQYGFDLHKGYGTKAHQQALADYGPCGLHRYSFAPLRKWRQ